MSQLDEINIKLYNKYLSKVKLNPHISLNLANKIQRFICKEKHVVALENKKEDSDD